MFNIDTINRCLLHALRKFGESSNGRTADSGSVSEGSTPSSPATQKIAQLVQWIEHVATDHEIGVRILYWVPLVFKVELFGLRHLPYKNRLYLAILR